MMNNNPESSRRGFIKKLATSTAAVAVGTNVFATSVGNSAGHFQIHKRHLPGINDNINIALIGAGGMGTQDTLTALKVPGFKLVAVCDLYDGRLQDAKKRLGPDLYTTRNYKEILNRSDVDAVIVATPDHWHQQISVDAMRAGKHVYCEKPMVHSITEGPAVIKAQRETGKVFQVGSQGVSSLGNEKAKELLKDGAIGELNFAEGFWARHSPTGAWQYPIPADASPETVDWETFISNTTKRPFDPTRFFRWRNYRDYGTGMSGDLFVHLFSSLHFITNSFGPEKIYASGGLRYWKDGREVPDVLLGIFDYPQQAQAHPAFNLSLRCNFIDGTSGTTYLKLVGSEGSMDIGWDSVTLKRNKTVASDDPFFIEQMKKAGTPVSGRKRILAPEEYTFTAEKGYMGGPYDHFVNFSNAIKNNGKVAEDAIFGYRAAAPALLCNDSYNNDRAILWNPEKMQIIKNQLIMMTNFLRNSTLVLMALSIISCSASKTSGSKDSVVAKGVTAPGTSKSLFDGKTLAGWHGFNKTGDVKNWTIIDGALVCLGAAKGDTGGDLVSDKEYENFELSWDWKIDNGGNSGVMYHVVENSKYKGPYETGPEYQMIDDIGYPGKLEAWQLTGADYAMNLTNDKKKLKPIGNWNSSKILYNKGHVEHWLNGEKIVEFQAGDNKWQKEKTEGKWKDYPDYGLAKSGKIALQDHGNKAYFKNIMIKEL